MSSLTSTQINQTYPGLLKLEDATSGITNTLQTIQDGLGNDLPLKVKNGQIQGQNLFSFGYFVPDYEGTGFINTAGQFPTGSQNKLVATGFYNPGLHSFSAITYRVQTATTSSDTAELCFYTTQFVAGLGLQPKDLIMSGINLETGSTGLKTLTLPSTLSFSAYGSGIYFAVIKITNSGVQPTIRYAQGALQGAMSQYSQQLGFSFEASGAHLITPIKQSSSNATANAVIYNSIANFQTSFSSGDFSGGILSATFVGLGFGLNVIK